MTKITFFTSGGVYYGFEEHGHTGLGEEGDDILCAALSAMTMLIINAAELSFDSEVDYTIAEDSADVKVVIKSALKRYEGDEKRAYALSGLLKAYYYQLMDLTEEYYDYLDVEAEERDPETEVREGNGKE